MAADLGVGWVAMHMVGDPRTMQRDPRYDDVVDDVTRFLVERADRATGAGVGEVWVDPGIGFGKTTAHNVALLARLDHLVARRVPGRWSAPAASGPSVCCWPARTVGLRPTPVRPGAPRPSTGPIPWPSTTGWSVR